MKVKLDGGDAFSTKKRFDNEIRTIIGEFTQREWDATPLKSVIQKSIHYITAIIEMEGFSDRFHEFPDLRKR